MMIAYPSHRIYFLRRRSGFNDDPSWLLDWMVKLIVSGFFASLCLCGDVYDASFCVLYLFCGVFCAFPSHVIYLYRLQNDQRFHRLYDCYVCDVFCVYACGYFYDGDLFL